MIKRVVIAGSRDFTDYETAKAYLDECLAIIRREYTVVILSGGCEGADRIGERYAAENGLTIEQYPALWKRYGKRAGIVRNEEMAEAADLVICFWDGQSRGTESMITIAKRLKKTVKIKEIP